LGDIQIDLSKVGDGRLADEEVIFFAKQDDEDVRKKKLLNDGIAQDNTQRLDYAEKAYGLVQTWVGFLIVLVCAQFSLKGIGFGLDKEEFIAVILSLSASVFGFWLLVGRYLFPSKDNSK